MAASPHPDSSTLIATVLTADIAGVPSSLTRTVTIYTPYRCDGAVVHVNRPVRGSIPAPSGAPGSKLNVSPLAGQSGSPADAVKLSVPCFATV